MRYILTLLLAGAVLAGCTQTQQDAALYSSDVAGRLGNADQLLQSGQVEETVTSASMSAEQANQLDQAFNTYEAVRERLASIIDNPEQAVDAMPIIRQQHARLVDAYQTAQEVVASNWSDYDAVAQDRLDRWRGQAERLEIAYQSMIGAIEESRNESQRAAQIIELAKIVARLALMAV